jgi:hypothetical protein
MKEKHAVMPVAWISARSMFFLLEISVVGRSGRIFTEGCIVLLLILQHVVAHIQGAGSWGSVRSRSYAVRCTVVSHHSLLSPTYVIVPMTSRRTKAHRVRPLEWQVVGRPAGFQASCLQIVIWFCPSMKSREELTISHDSSGDLLIDQDRSANGIILIALWLRQGTQSRCANL